MKVKLQLLTMLETAVRQTAEIKFLCPFPLLQERNYWFKEANYFMTIVGRQTQGLNTIVQCCQYRLNIFQNCSSFVGSNLYVVKSKKVVTHKQNSLKAREHTNITELVKKKSSTVKAFFLSVSRLCFFTLIRSIPFSCKDAHTNREI